MFLIISQILQKSTCVGVSTWRAGNFIKKRVQHRCFPVKYVKFLRAVNLKNISHRRCSLRKGVLRNFAKFIWKHLCQSYRSEACNFIKKEILAQVFSCEFCEILKSTFYTEYLWATAFDCSKYASGDYAINPFFHA